MRSNPYSVGNIGVINPGGNDFDMTEQSNSKAILTFTTEIIASHVSFNQVPATELPGLVRQIYSSLANAGSGGAAPERAQPAVPIRRSVTPDYIVCLEDGKKLKMLKRHLKTAFDLTPEAYREKWGLAADYPMVAPKYAALRRALAKKIGLGTRPRRRR